MGREVSERTARAKLWRQEREGWPGTSQCLRLEQSAWQDGKGVDTEGRTNVSCPEGRKQSSRLLL